MASVTDHGTAGAGDPLSIPSLAEWAQAVDDALDGSDVTVDARDAAAQAAAEATAAGALTAHNGDSTNVHGIADTAALVLTDDARLSDVRTPTAHAASHAAAGADPVTVAESQVTGLTAALALKAPLASPALTGTPTAPTAAQGTATTQVATTAHVATEVGLLVPKALYDANTILAATTDNTLAALTVPASSLVGRGLTGNIAALSVADVRTLVGTTRVTRPLTDDRLIETWNGAAWSVTGYDSGWRDVSSSVNAAYLIPAGGYIYLRRVNNSVFLSLVIQVGGSTTSAFFYVPPSGFRGYDPPTAYGVGFQGTTISAMTTPVGITQTVSGIKPPGGVVASRFLVFERVFLTADAIPTTLPGTLVSAAPQ